MKSLIERYSNLSSAGETLEFLEDFRQSEEFHSLLNDLEGLDDKSQASVLALMSVAAYSLAKIDELQDKVTALERQNVNLN